MAQASAGSIRAGKAHVEIGTDQNPLVRGLSQASQRVQAWAKAAAPIARKAFIGGLAVIGAGAKLFGDWSRLKPAFMDLRGAISSALAPTVSMLSDKIAGLVHHMGVWVRSNPGIVNVLAKLVLGFTAAAGAAYVLAKSVQILFGAFKVFSAIGTIAVGALGMIMSLVTTLISPLGLVVGIVGGLTAAFLTLTDTGKAMTDTIGSAFGEMGATVAKTWTGIMDALQAGDVYLAARVLWAGLKVIWVQATQGLKDVWDQFTASLTDNKEAASGGIAEWFVNFGTAIRRSWTHTVNFVANAWEHTVAAMKIAWHTLIEGIEKGWAFIKSLLPGGEEYESAAARIDQIASAKNAATRQERDQAIAANEAKLANIDRQQLADNAGLVNEIRAQEERAQRQRERARKQARDDEKAAAMAELQEALDNLNTVNNEAAEELKRIQQRAPLGTMPMIGPPDLDRKLQMTTAGTFNAFAARGFGVGGGIQEKQFKELVGANERLGRIERKMGPPQWRN